MKNLNRHAAHVGVFFVIIYAICLSWRFVLGIQPAQDLHELALKVAFPGFQGYDAASIIWGGVLSFVYGFLASQIFHRMHKNCCEPK